MRPKVSIIVLNYNGVLYLRNCLLSLIKQKYYPLEIIVIDNNSTDGSVAYVQSLKNKFSEKILLIKNKKNYGYCKANNIAAKKASGSFLFFINNDVEIFDNTIDQLIKCYRPKSIVTGCQIQIRNKTSVGSSGAGCDIFGYPYIEDYPKKTRVFYADGAMFFIKKKDFINLGGFDEKLFIFQEDIDLSWRAQMQGYKIISCWRAKLYHYGGATVRGGFYKGTKYRTSLERRFLNEKNVIRNILKNYSFPLCFFILILLLILHLFEILILLIILKWPAIISYLKAYWWNIIHLKNTLRFRKKIQRLRFVSDLKLMKRMYLRYSKLNSLLKVGIPEFK